MFWRPVQQVCKQQICHVNLKMVSITAAVAMENEHRVFKKGEGKLFEIELLLNLKFFTYVDTILV